MKQKNKATKHDIRAYMHAMELESLVEGMAYAMRQADPAYVAQGRMTPRMEHALESFYTWALAAQ